MKVSFMFFIFANNKFCPYLCYLNNFLRNSWKNLLTGNKMNGNISYCMPRSWQPLRAIKSHVFNSFWAINFPNSFNLIVEWILKYDMTLKVWLDLYNQVFFPTASFTEKLSCYHYIISANSFHYTCIKLIN